MIRDRGNHCIEVVGPMTVEHAKSLAREGIAALRRTDTVFDLSPVTRVDSSALAVIFSWMRVAQASGRSVHVINAPKNLVNLAKVYEVVTLLPLDEPSSSDDATDPNKSDA
ncbi:MAG: STAS domain-containing protein [Betaproteobacteria bacterium]|nr:STAS domain-containing protein [Betaproteobacteria bacterium]